MSDIRPLQVAGSGAHTTDNIACSRSDIREQHEREERARLNPTKDLTPQQRLGAMYEELHRRELAQRAAERAEKIRTGVIVLNPDGSETEYLNGYRRK